MVTHVLIFSISSGHKRLKLTMIKSTRSIEFTTETTSIKEFVHKVTVKSRLKFWIFLYFYPNSTHQTCFFPIKLGAPSFITPFNFCPGHNKLMHVFTHIQKEVFPCRCAVQTFRAVQFLDNLGRLGYASR
jgi:hypothetical protein